MKLVIVKKGARKWTAVATDKPSGYCCWAIESAFFPCYEIGLNG